MCRLIERRSVRAVLWGVEEGIKGLTFAGLIALLITVVAGTPHQQFVTPKTQHRVGQLQELNRQLDRITYQLSELSQQNIRLYTRLLRTSAVLPEVPSDTAHHRRSFHLAGAEVPPIDSSLARLHERVGRLQQQVVYQQALTSRREEWLEQSPIVLPAEGAIASGFGMRHHPIHEEERLHQGIDISVPGGTPVLATGTGLVVAADSSGGYGHHVRILHPATGHLTLYAHLSQVPTHVQSGRWINRGETIGYSGHSGVATGPHLHYEIRDREGHPLNPMKFLLPPRREHSPHPRHALARIDSLILRSGV